MIQNQLIEYINAQIKAGTSRDAIRTTLVSTGWPAQDVDDTLKSLEGTKAASGTTAPASSQQVVRVSDLVSGSSSAMSSSPATITASAPKEAMKSPMTGSPAAATVAAKPSSPAVAAPASLSAMPMGKPIIAKPSRGPLITEIVLGALFVVALAGAGYLFFQNQGLNGQLSSLNKQSADLTAKFTALQNEMVASTTVLAARTNLLNGQTAELQTELSFYAAPPATTPGATATVMFSGTVLAGGKYGYIIVGAYGARVPVVNSQAAGVKAALAPLVASSSVSQFQGLYIPASGLITITSVNGADVTTAPGPSAGLTTNPQATSTPPSGTPAGTSTTPSGK